MNVVKWKPVEDLPADWHTLCSSELASLAPIWIEQSEKLNATGVLQQFNERLGREWAIETGIIENLYSIDRGITQILVERGIEASLIPHGATDKPAEEIVAILKDQEHALEGLFDFVKRRRELSTSYVKELHQSLTRSQSTVRAVDQSGNPMEVQLEHGQWKRLPNNPTRQNGSVHEYCPPEHVASEMDRLIAMHLAHVEEYVPPEVEAAWLHHRFSEIHPFQDGNGRVARALSSLVFLRARWFPLVIHRDIRQEYIEALEASDSGNLKDLTLLFTSVQIKSFLRALNISEDVLRVFEPIQQVIAKAAERLKARFEEQVEKQREVFDLASHLESLTKERLDVVARELNSELKKVSDTYFATADGSKPETDFWFKYQIVELAKKADYFADTRTYATWVRLRIQEERRAELVISFHSLGVDFLGILAASVFLEFRDKSEEGEATVDGPYPLSKEIFQCSFNETKDVVEVRFADWLNKALLSGLDQWRRQI